jgi:hypothetical protein
MAKPTAAAALQKALQGGAKTPPADQPGTTKVAAVAHEGGSYKAPSREGKTPITAFLSPDFKSGLRLIQAKRGGTVQDLMAEALNDLFTKYHVPTVSE